jgi:hypothetical protein
MIHPGMSIIRTACYLLYDAENINPVPELVKTEDVSNST